MKFELRFAGILGVALCSLASAQTPGAPAADQNDPARASVALSPAVSMIRCQPGESTTRTFIIVNHTANAINFNVTAEDVVVREGKRTYSPPGEVANSIAASAVASQSSVLVKAGEEASAQVTLTLPPNTAQRAVVIFFRGSVQAATSGAVGLNASLGALITFNVSADYKVESGPMQVSPQTPTSNLILSEELRNSGSEPVVPKGVIVILNSSGKRVAKALFNPKRLLPGEQLVFSVTNPAKLAPGDYRTVTSFAYEGKVLTSEGEFSIPE